MSHWGEMDHEDLEHDAWNTLGSRRVNLAFL